MKFDAQREDEIYVWIDFACIDQDDKEKQMKGIKSLKSYVAKSNIMLVPTTYDLFEACPEKYGNEWLPEYGPRAWCRTESFVFSTMSITRAPTERPNLFVVHNENKEVRYIRYDFGSDGSPSAGQLTDENDRKLLRKLEDEVKELRNKSLISSVKGNKNIDLSNGGIDASLFKTFAGQVSKEVESVK